MKPTRYSFNTVPNTLPAQYPLGADDGIAAAGDENPAPPMNAEYIRCKEEMGKLAVRNAWGGVESNYQRIVELNRKDPSVKIEAAVHILGGYAARGLGNIADYYSRCLIALSASPSPELEQEIQSDLTDIRANYNYISISVPDESFSLTVSVMPFAPDQSKSISFANKQLAENRSFTGLIAANCDYTLSSTNPAYSSQQESFHLDPMGDVTTLTPAKTINVEAPKLAERLSSKERKPRNIHGEFGIATGYQTLSPTYGNTYTLGGMQTSLFAGSFYDIALGQHLLIRPGIRIAYSNSILRDSQSDYALSDSALTGALRLSGIYDLGQWGIGASASLSHGAHFTDQGEIDPILGASANTSIGVGSANVPLNNINIIQTPILGAGILMQRDTPLINSPTWLELDYQRAVIGMEGTLIENPEWNSAAPFVNQQVSATLGIGF